jgi:hypothetical protein
MAREGDPRSPCDWDSSCKQRAGPADWKGLCTYLDADSKR